MSFPSTSEHVLFWQVFVFFFHFPRIKKDPISFKIHPGAMIPWDVFQLGASAYLGSD